MAARKIQIYFSWLFSGFNQVEHWGPSLGTPTWKEFSKHREAWSRFRRVHAGCQVGPARLSSLHPAVLWTAEERAEPCKLAWQWQTSHLISPSVRRSAIHNWESRIRDLGHRCGKCTPLNLTRSINPPEITVLRVCKYLQNSNPHLCEWRELITAQNSNTALPPMEQMAPYRRCVQATQTQRNRWTRSLQLSNHHARSRDELCPQSSAITLI